MSILIEEAALMFFDPATLGLLRTRPSPLTWDQARRLRGAYPAGPPPRASKTAARPATGTTTSCFVALAVELGLRDGEIDLWKRCR